MATLAGVGRSLSEEAPAAGREAAEAALDQLPGHRADVCLVFATTGYDQIELLGGIAEVTGDTELIGCSGEGIIALSDSMERDHAVAVMAIQSTTMSFEPYLIENYEEDPAACGRDLARTIGSDPDGPPIGVLVFPDGLRGNCSRFLESLQDALPFPVVVAGGTSADNMTFVGTYQYLGERAVSGAVAALLIRGRGHLEVAVSHGCAPIGLERNVTRADDGWVREIDGIPAWHVFKEYLDGDPEDLNADGIVHLCIGEPMEPEAAVDYAPYIIRTPLGLDKESGALFFPGGGLTNGRRIQLTRRDPTQIRESALKCATSILERKAGRKPVLVLQFDCAGRGKVLFGTQAAREIVEPLVDALGKETPWLGFHSYGEIAPIARQFYYHNYTVVLCALYEDDA